MDRRGFLRIAGAGVVLAGCTSTRNTDTTTHTLSTSPPTTEPGTEPTTTERTAGSSTTEPVTTAASTTEVATTDAATTEVATTEVATTVAPTVPPTTVPPTSVPATLDELAAMLQGRLVRPSDGDYDAVRFLQNTKFDAIEPAAIVVVQSAADAGAAISYARSQSLPFAVRSGGHSYGGWSSCPGIVIDVRGLTSITVDSSGTTAAIGSGAALVDVYSTLAASGVSIAAGSCPTVGIAGLALGGGHGLSSRSFGLTCDALRAVEIVTADGTVHQCDGSTEPDLFWACRGGGGGSFGVVTGFTFDVHPIPANATTYVLKYSWNNAAAAAAAWVQWVPTLADATSTLCRFEGTPQLTIAGLHLGTADEANTVLAPLFGLAKSHSVSPHTFIDALMLEAGCSHASVTECHTSEFTPGGTLTRPTPFVATSHYYAAPLTADAIKTAMDAIDNHTTMVGSRSATIQFDAYGGAIGRVARDATAFVHRNAFCSAQYASFYGGAGDSDRAWLTATRRALEPFSNGEAYQNYADPDLENWAMAYYGANLPKLQQVKNTYDPANAFSFPQSIPL